VGLIGSTVSDFVNNVVQQSFKSEKLISLNASVMAISMNLGRDATTSRPRRLNGAFSFPLLALESLVLRIDSQDRISRDSKAIGKDRGEKKGADLFF
jgi:hypothetical protein